MTDAPPTGYALVDLGKGYSERFGPVFVDRDGGRMAFRVDERHINPVDGLHGGALATFADAMIVAVHDGAEAGAPHTPTISLSIEYFAPVPQGALVEAVVDLVRTTASMIFVQSLMSVGERRIGRASAIYRNPSYSGEAR
ncbi:MULTISPECIES: PaaI family thioesterase [unclassified Sphingopyxis]|uniref:PaaI family thioesterase n=1 Tax=unclassified Sphingopyxis TaxID=2614943 RepID=UPI00285E5F04|nr:MULTISPECIES: PaaI family thioesterase [unclassified Sphingopyxis]MDR6834101.1 uncharacterized protein (TIGR00369 family) [Sphingopyxis sp. BE122]MDR7226369.1 uncharacterized protein (TIGR00369 family) [Sphingopyxis sp. BE259]